MLVLLKTALPSASTIGLPDVFDVQDGDHDAFGVAQGDLGAAGVQGLGEGFRDVERDRHRPKNAAARSHVAADAFVVGLLMKPVSGEKPPLRSISRSQIWRGVEVPRWEVARVGFGVGHLFAVED